MKEKNIIAGERLKQSRLKAKKTLEQIGVLCGVHKTTVMRWEKGEIEKTSYLKDAYNLGKTV